MAQTGSAKIVRIRSRGRSRAAVAAAAAAAAPAPRPPLVAREAIALAFEQIGGVATFAEWIKASDDNRKLFYTNLYPKIIALQPGEEPAAEPIHEIRRTIVHP